MYTCLLFHLADHIFRVSGFRQNLHTQRQRCDSVNWNTLMNGQDISSKFSNGAQNIRKYPRFIIHLQNKGNCSSFCLIMKRKNIVFVFVKRAAADAYLDRKSVV